MAARGTWAGKASGAAMGDPSQYLQAWVRCLAHSRPSVTSGASESRAAPRYSKLSVSNGSALSRARTLSGHPWAGGQGGHCLRGRVMLGGCLSPGLGLPAGRIRGHEIMMRLRRGN